MKECSWNTLNTQEALGAARFLWEWVGEDLEFAGGERWGQLQQLYLLKSDILSRSTWKATDCGWESPWHLQKSYGWRCLRGKSCKGGCSQSLLGLSGLGAEEWKMGKEKCGESVVIIASGTSFCRALYLVSILHIEFHVKISLEWNVPRLIKNTKQNSEISTTEEGVVLRHGRA